MSQNREKYDDPLPPVGTPLPEVEETAGILGGAGGPSSGAGGPSRSSGLEVAVRGTQEGTGFGVGARAGAGGGGLVGVYSGDLRQPRSWDLIPQT